MKTLKMDKSYRNSEQMLQALEGIYGQSFLWVPSGKIRKRTITV